MTTKTATTTQSSFSMSCGFRPVAVRNRGRWHFMEVDWGWWKRFGIIGKFGKIYQKLIRIPITPTTTNRQGQALGEIWIRRNGMSRIRRRWSDKQNFMHFKDDESDSNSTSFPDFSHNPNTLVWHPHWHNIRGIHSLHIKSNS